MRIGVASTVAMVVTAIFMVPAAHVGAQMETTMSFVDRSRAAGVAYEPTMSWGSNWGDFDSDGDADLFANRHWKVPRLYRNLGNGTYALRSETFPSAIGDRFFDRHMCAWGEANGDGNVDLSCAAGAVSGTGSAPKQLWIQTANSFADRTEEFGVSHPKGRTRTVNWIDHDGDGDLDLFYLNKLRRGVPNVFFRNDRGVFTQVDVGVGDQVNGLSSTWADWDADGDPDLLVTRYHPERTVAYENVGGTFEKVTLTGITTKYWTSSAWGDFDGDGLSDLALADHTRFTIFGNVGGAFEPVQSVPLARGAGSAWLDVEQDGDLDVFVVQARKRGVNRPDFLLIQDAGTFRRMDLASIRGPKGGAGEAVSVADHDRDGLLDAFVTNGATLDEESQIEGRWSLLENRSTPGNWIAIELQGSDWNPWGYGARIFVDTDGPDYWREVNDGLGLRGQSETGHLVLGYGDAELVNIRIEWADGEVDCVTGTPGQTVAVPKGLRPCVP